MADEESIGAVYRRSGPLINAKSSEKSLDNNLTTGDSGLVSLKTGNFEMKPDMESSNVYLQELYQAKCERCMQDDLCFRCR